MKKEDLLQPQIEEILHRIDFIGNYRRIWEKYPYQGENYKISKEEIINGFKKNGFEVRQYGKDQFFSDFIQDDDFIYRVGITIKYNIIHFDLSIKNEKLGIHLGGDFGLIVQLMTNWALSVKSPSFNSNEKFNSLLDELISLFRAIKYNIAIGQNW